MALGAGAALGLYLFYVVAKNLIFRYMKQPVSRLRISSRGLEFIKKHEALRLKSYTDPGGVWTIGYGHTTDPFFAVKPNQTINEDFADALLRHDVEEAETLLRNRLRNDLHLTQNQYDALVSHTFNTGGSSTLFDLVNAEADNDKIVHWIKTTYITQNGKRLRGLVRRRNEEAEMFIT